MQPVGPLQWGSVHAVQKAHTQCILTELQNMLCNALCLQYLQIHIAVCVCVSVCLLVYLSSYFFVVKILYWIFLYLFNKNKSKFTFLTFHLFYYFLSSQHNQSKCVCTSLIRLFFMMESFAYFCLTSGTFVIFSYCVHFL